ncbi:MAG: hypothetical protein LBG67_02010 [Campylobacteraceae bacterium]|jgi:hypothetical protein|nr:hypothetical protein [Campylobacteraceae bacterium]
MKEELLKEIAFLLKANEGEEDISLEVMNFLNDEELINIRDAILRRKINRKEEQEIWYNEWVEKFKK